MTDDRWRSFPIPICRGSQQDYSSFRKRLNLGQNWKWEFHNASTSIGKARNMGRNRRRGRCNDNRLRLGGWVTGGTADRMVATSAQDASVLALTPLCVAKGEQQPEQLVLLKKEGSWNRGEFVTKAGWVGNVNEKYRSAVAKACATTLVDDLDAKP